MIAEQREEIGVLPALFDEWRGAFVEQRGAFCVRRGAFEKRRLWNDACALWNLVPELYGDVAEGANVIELRYTLPMETALLHEPHTLVVPADLFERIARKARMAGVNADKYAIATLSAHVADDWQERLRDAQEYVTRLRAESDLTDEEIEADIDAEIQRYRAERAATEAIK